MKRAIFCQEKSNDDLQGTCAPAKYSPAVRRGQSCLSWPPSRIPSCDPQRYRFKVPDFEYAITCSPSFSSLETRTRNRQSEEFSKTSKCAYSQDYCLVCSAWFFVNNFGKQTCNQKALQQKIEDVLATTWDGKTLYFPNPQKTLPVHAPPVCLWMETPKMRELQGESRECGGPSSAPSPSDTCFRCHPSPLQSPGREGNSDSLQQGIPSPCFSEPRWGILLMGTLGEDRTCACLKHVFGKGPLELQTSLGQEVALTNPCSPRARATVGAF